MFYEILVWVLFNVQLKISFSATEMYLTLS